MRRALLLAWYFAVAGGTVGPFDNEAKCNEIRGGLVAKISVISACWYYGGERLGQPVYPGRMLEALPLDDPARQRKD